MWQLTRRSWLRATGLASLAGSIIGGARLTGQVRPGTGVAHHPAHGSHVMGTVGRVPTDTFNPTAFLKAWNFNDLAAHERSRFYRETPRPDGTMLREYEIFAVDRE